MSQLTPLEPDAYNHMYEFIAESLPEVEQHKFRDEVKMCWETSAAGKLVELLLSHSATIMAKPSDRDVEGGYQVIISLLDKLKDPGDRPATMKRIVADIRSSDSRPGLRLKLLCICFNLLRSSGGSSERFETLLAVLEFARDTKQLDALADVLEGLASHDWRRGWRDLSMDQHRQLYLAVADALQTAGRTADAHKFLLNFLSSFSAHDDLGAVKDLAVKAVVGAIKGSVASLTSVSNLLSIRAVRQLEADPEHKAVYELLQVFSFKKLSDFLEYKAKHGDVLSRYTFDADKAVHDMRLLSLALLASEVEQIPYADICAILEVSQDEVEDWVVRAITAGLIEARMDQQQEMVIISRSVHRHFTMKDWLRLQSQLHDWTRNVKSLLTTIRETRVVA